jgi:hypothetical protein
VPNSITRPKRNATLHTLTFAASGRAESTVTSVTGLVTNDTGFAFANTATIPPAAGNNYRWSIPFKVPASGDYLLTVTFHNGDGSQVTLFPVPFSVQAHYLVGFGWPNSGDLDISQDASNFCPYGSLDQYDVSSITLVEQGTNIHIPLLGLSSDPTGLKFWSAQFDSITGLGRYFTLTLVDTNNSTYSLPGIHT